jgi:hypothetical protein
MANTAPAKPASAPEEPQVPTEEYIKTKATGPTLERRVPKSVPKANYCLRTIKMVQPICAECQWPPRARWWKTCPHDPYTIQESEEIVTPDLQEDEHGDFIVKGEEVKIRVHRYLNLAQVPLTEAVNGGRGLEQAQARGFVFPEEFDQPPMCQYYDCWEESPKFHTIYGDFCNADQARLIGADEENIVLEVLEPSKRREQLRRIDLSST